MAVLQAREMPGHGVAIVATRLPGYLFIYFSTLEEKSVNVHICQDEGLHWMSASIALHLTFKKTKFLTKLGAG